jgi:general L-amino acid transport system permease protein
MREALGYYLANTGEEQVTNAVLRDLAPGLRDAVYIRPSYFHWPTTIQAAGLGMILTAFGALITCLFKNPRFIDMACLELLAFVYAVLVGFPFGDMTDALSWTMIVGGGLILRVAIIGYAAWGYRPNLTFFNRVRRA